MHAAVLCPWARGELREAAEPEDKSNGHLSEEPKALRVWRIAVFSNRIGGQREPDPVPP